MAPEHSVREMKRLTPVPQLLSSPSPGPQGRAAASPAAAQGALGGRLCGAWGRVSCRRQGCPPGRARPRREREGGGQRRSQAGGQGRQLAGGCGLPEMLSSSRISHLGFAPPFQHLPPPAGHLGAYRRLLFPPSLLPQRARRRAPAAEGTGTGTETGTRAGTAPPPGRPCRQSPATAHARCPAARCAAHEAAWLAEPLLSGGGGEVGKYASGGREEAPCLRARSISFIKTL